MVKAEKPEFCVLRNRNPSPSESIMNKPTPELSAAYDVLVSIWTERLQEGGK